MKYGENLFGRRDPRLPRDPTDRPARSEPPECLAGARAHVAARAQRAGRACLRGARCGNQAEDGAGSKLIVGPNIKLKGVEIEDCDTLVVEGRIEATMVSRAIQIAERGSFAARSTWTWPRFAARSRASSPRARSS